MGYRDQSNIHNENLSGGSVASEGQGGGSVASEGGGGDSFAASDGRAARNSLLLALRIVLVTIVSLYTSRIVIDSLGLSDYGIYGVLGSLVGIWWFLNGTVSGATVRYLCYEHGRNSGDQIRKAFTSAMTLHIGVAMIVVVLCETAGLWYFDHKLNIPPGRAGTAMWVYQLTILACIIDVTQEPYGAVILARERMSVYAYMEVIKAALRLGLVSILVWLPGDRLVAYAIITLGLSVVFQLSYRMFCVRNFPEAHLSWPADMQYVRAMAKYSVTDLYGNICYSGCKQSMPLLLNAFFGVIYNASANTALAIQNALQSLANTILTAYKPQVMKLYARQDIRGMERVMQSGVKFNAICYSLVAIPVIIYAPLVFELWLGEVPPLAVIFLRIILVYSFVESLSFLAATGIHASGKIKRFSIVTGTMFLSIPVLIYAGFKCGLAAWTMYAVYGVVMVLITAADFMYLKLEIKPFSISGMLLCIVRVYLVVFCGAACLYWLAGHTGRSLPVVLACCGLYVLISGVLSWLFILGRSERSQVSVKLRAIWKCKK